MITCLSIRKLYKSSKFYPSPTSRRSSSHHLFPRSLQAVFYPKPWGVVTVVVSCELVFLTCLGNCVQRYAEQVYIWYIYIWYIYIYYSILLFTYTCSLIKEKLYMLEFVREIQTRGIHSNSILLLVPQSWRVWTSIITLCSSSRCLCIYICFLSSFQLSHWPGSESAPLGSKDEVVKVEVKEEKQEKPPVQTLEKDAAIFFLLKNKVLQRCTKFRHYFVYSFLEAEKEPTKKRCMRMPERQFLLTDHVMGIRQRDSSKGEWQQLVG